MVEIRSAYSEPLKVEKKFEKPSRAKQSFKDECDVNNILRKYKRSLGVDFLNTYHGFLGGRFGDVSASVDLQSAYATIDEARVVFEAMPAKLRSRFENDPVKLLEFLGNVNNRDEAIELGLLQRPNVPTEQVK